jgi:hypothetical protein
MGITTTKVDHPIPKPPPIPEPYSWLHSWDCIIQNPVRIGRVSEWQRMAERARQMNGGRKVEKAVDGFRYSWLHSWDCIIQNPVRKGRVSEWQRMAEWSKQMNGGRKVEKAVDGFRCFLFSYEASYVQL